MIRNAVKKKTCYGVSARNSGDRLFSMFGIPLEPPKPAEMHVFLERRLDKNTQFSHTAILAVFHFHRSMSCKTYALCRFILEIGTSRYLTII